MKLLKKKVNVFGKSIPVLAIFVLGLALVSATLLSYFGQITGNVTVTQGLLVDGQTYENPITEPAVTMTSLEEKTFLDAHWLDNQATVEAVVYLNAKCSSDLSPNSCAEIVTSYYDYSEKSYLLVEDADAVDCGSKVAGDLYVTVTPKKDSVVYEVELPTDFFDEISANINFQISLTDSDSEDNFQVTYYPGDLHWKLNWDWKFMTPSISQTTEVEGESSVLLLDEVVSVEYIDNLDSPDVVKVEINKPEAVQSFGVQASDGGLGYCPFYTPSWGDKDGNGDVYRSGGFSNQGTLSHEVVGTELANPITVPAVDILDFVIVNHFPQMTYPGTYTITTTVDNEAL